jgi:hypothetical protein
MSFSPAAWDAMNSGLSAKSAICHHSSFELVAVFINSASMAS